MNPWIEAVELGAEAIEQSEEEKIVSLMKLGISRKRSLFIVKMRDSIVKGDTVNVSAGEYQQEGVLEHS